MHPRITAAFPATIRSRGDDYFFSRRVRIVRASSSELTALVTGTERYLVAMLAQSGVLSASCSCPYAAEKGICKHLWAALRQAHQEHKLQPLVQTVGDGMMFAALPADGPRDIDDDVIFDMPVSAPRAPAATEWKSMLDAARRTMAISARNDPARPRESWPSDRRIVYKIDLATNRDTTGIAIDLATEKRTKNGDWSHPSMFRIPVDTWRSVPDPLDREIAQLLLGARPQNTYTQPHVQSRFILTGPAVDTTLRLICETGRCRVSVMHGAPKVVRWDDGPAWALSVRVTRDQNVCITDAILRRPDAVMSVVAADVLHPAGVLLIGDTLARFNHHGAFPLAAALRATPTVRFDESELPAFLEAAFTLPNQVPVELPPDAHVTEIREQPQPGIAIHPDPSPWRTTHHRLEPFFLYGDIRVDARSTAGITFDRATLTVRHRDSAFEAEIAARLTASGVRSEWSGGEFGKCLTISIGKLAHLVPDLAAEGWRVEANGTVFRAPGESHARVTSGVDWFELHAGVRFGAIDVSLAELLAARKTGATTILLADGSQAVLPADWLARLGSIAAGATMVNGALRFKQSQAGLLDALLTTMPEASVDATFERARTELRAFDSVAAVDPPSTFRGTLREYQREGLGWLHFLRKFGLGGCLADDMGLGKTVQVLALLDDRRGTNAKPRRPSIVVVPSSIVYNWFREAAHFAPRLRLLDYTGVARNFDAIEGGEVDVVITTYGTLRRDAAKLATVAFDYAILDEAQAIKTAGTASAKAARLLRADHRLAMTGTPIENRLEELWSLLEFLNPGMLGASSAFSRLTRLTSVGDGSTVPVGRDVLARALRPVILRRTKDQVARDLPPRVEQTLAVELEGPQRKFYDDLLEAYRRSVLDRVDRMGLGKAKMHILEALLRLRQAACHPALADPRKAGAASAKLDALIPALDEVVSEGHKALVFSQFTSFLALLRERLDKSGVVYEYLDGKVRDRQSRVDRFQNDPACPLFLISLKAGGQGLNLTAADYVFILDPWWNPAVEAQAIDRAHRIGQTRRVIATRIVAANTIEEKILELQASKRALADAILGQDQGVLAGIGRAELEMLLE